MQDAYLQLPATFDVDGTEQLTAPLKLTAEGDHYIIATDAAGTSGSGSSGVIPPPTTQIAVSYWEALTTSSGQWIAGDTLKRTQVSDITNPAAPVVVSTVWYNERSKATITVTPVVDTDVTLSGETTIQTIGGAASELTLTDLYVVTADTSISDNVTSNKSFLLSTSGKSTVYLSIKGTGTLGTAPVISTTNALGEWIPITSISANAPTLTTGNNQLLRFDCAAYNILKITFGTVTGAMAVLMRASSGMQLSSGSGSIDLSTVNAKLDLIKTRQSLEEVTVQNLDITASAAVQSATINPLTKRVVLQSFINCWFEIGTNPTATKGTGTSKPLSAGVPSYPIDLPAGSKISVISDNANGKLSIFESL